MFRLPGGYALMFQATCLAVFTGVETARALTFRGRSWGCYESVPNHRLGWSRLKEEVPWAPQRHLEGGLPASPPSPGSHVGVPAQKMGNAARPTPQARGGGQGQAVAEWLHDSVMAAAHTPKPMEDTGPGHG